MTLNGVISTADARYLCGTVELLVIQLRQVKNKCVMTAKQVSARRHHRPTPMHAAE